MRLLGRHWVGGWHAPRHFSHFDAASLRDIGERAGVSQQLITHHFKTKLGLWKAAVDGIFEAARETHGARMRGLEGVSDPERMRLLPRRSG